MAKTASASIKLSLLAELASTLDLGSAVYSPNYSASFNLTNGTGADQIKQVFTDSRTIAASGSEDLDLAGGLTDAFGAAITFAAIKALVVKASASNTNDVVLGGHVTAPFSACFGDVSDKVKVKPGGLLVIVAPDASGYPVTAGAADILTIANSSSGSGVSYDIFILGTTA